MAVYQILIVDNQRKQRRDLRSAIETLGPDFKVTDAPSGEEAILLLSRQHIHLLVSEFRLAGMTGLELMTKVRQHHPDVKTIFITEAGQVQVKAQVTEAGVDAYFFKPVDMTEFLAAVKKCLRLDQAEISRKPDPQKAAPTGLPDTLNDLRQQLQAMAVLLMDRDGRVAVCEGELPIDVTESSLQAALKATFDAGVKVSWALGKLPPEDLSYFSGSKFDLYLAHVGQSTSLVLLTEPARDAETRGNILLHLPPVVNTLLRGFSTKDRLSGPLAESSLSQLGATSTTGAEAVDPELDSLLNRVSKPDRSSKDIDDFWEIAAEQASKEGYPKAGALSYEQARKLGLAPKDESQA
jgi:DNA-binding response OmpR family regulator